MRASRIEDDPSMLYVRLINPRIRSKQAAFYREDEARDTSNHLVRLPKNEFAQLRGEAILRRNFPCFGRWQDRRERNNPPFGDCDKLARYHEDITIPQIISDQSVSQRWQVEFRIHPRRSHRSERDQAASQTLPRLNKEYSPF